MKYKLKVDLGNYKKGDIVEVTHIEFNEVCNLIGGVQCIFSFRINMIKYLTVGLNSPSIKNDLVNRVFDEL